MRPLVVLLVLALSASLLTACSEVTGNENSVAIAGVWGDTQAYRNATEWCARYGRTPKLTSVTSERYVFECIKS
jgi:hypothetical protein